MQTEQIEPIHCVRWADGRVELLTAPPLSAITAELLDNLDEHHAHRDDDTLIFPGDVRYLLGDPVDPDDPDGRRYLHRLP